MILFLCCILYFCVTSASGIGRKFVQYSMHVIRQWAFYSHFFIGGRVVEHEFVCVECLPWYQVAGAAV